MYRCLVEGCPDGRIAFWSGLCKATGLLGTVLGMGLVALLREVLTEGQFYGWGWRVPFLTSVPVGCCGVYLRTFLNDSKELCSQSARKTEGIGYIKDTIKFHWPEIISTGVIVSFWATGFYTSFIWMAYYVTDLSDETPVSHGWLLNTLMLSLFVFQLPASGVIADKFARSADAAKDTAYRKSMVLGASVTILVGNEIALVRCFVVKKSNELYFAFSMPCVLLGQQGNCMVSLHGICSSFLGLSILWKLFACCDGE